MRSILTVPRPERERTARYVIETVDDEFRPTGTVVAEAETEKEALELADVMSAYQPVAVIDTQENRVDVGWGWAKRNNG